MFVSEVFLLERKPGMTNDESSVDFMIARCGAKEQSRRSQLFRLIGRFRRDETGAYAMVAAFALPVLVGAAAFGTEEGLLLYKQRQMQHAADSSAVSAAAAYIAGNSSITATVVKTARVQTTISGSSLITAS